jgi:adenosylcobinamide-GDP ribazoletransferase
MPAGEAPAPPGVDAPGARPHSSPAPRAALYRPLALAVGMLTVIRVPLQGGATASDLRSSLVAYPLVGALVGLFPAAVLGLPLPALPRAALALAAWVLVTGALHLDGWADCCDAAFAPPLADADATRRRRLDILKDPRKGTFGVAGIALLLLVKWSALAYAPLAAPIAAAVLSRWAMVYALRTWPPARKDGLAASLGDGAPVWAATVVALALLVALTFAADRPLELARAVSFGLLAALGAGAFLVRRFGGLTGDVCGAMGEVAEAVALVALLPWSA